MNKNLGKIDRITRFILALIFFYLFAAKVLAGIWVIIALALGVAFLMTSLLSYCPLYAPFGLSTGSKTPDEKI